jgi:hypothetical protein
MKPVISIPNELDIGGIIREGAEEYASFEVAALHAGIAALLDDLG